MKRGKESAGGGGGGLEMDELVGAPLDDLEPRVDNAVGLSAGLRSPSMSSSYRSFVDPTIVEPSPVRSEFESGDALFTFDEDVDLMVDEDLGEDKVGCSIRASRSGQVLIVGSRMTLDLMLRTGRRMRCRCLRLRPWGAYRLRSSGRLGEIQGSEGLMSEC